MRIFEAFRNAWKVEELRNRILFTVVMLLAFRLGCHVPFPGHNPAAIDELKSRSEEFGGVMGLIGVFTGGAFDNLAIFGLGIMPYITASIIMQLMTKVSKRLEAMAKEGPAGQRKIAQYTRYLAVPICIFQAAIAIPQLQAILRLPLTIETGIGYRILTISALTMGSMLVMWIGEQMSDHGIGNGASILIMVGILARIPQIYGLMIHEAGQPGSPTLMDIIVITSLFVAAIVGIVFITQAQRRIPIQHAKHYRGRRVWAGTRNYLPLRVNAAGVMPLIFASALLVIPAVLGEVEWLKFLKNTLQSGGFIYSLMYIGMIVFFSYFWTYLFYNPQEMSNNLREYGSFIPGIRPGEHTAEYINKILAHITILGAIFLCVIALFPQIVSSAIGTERYLVRFLGGTGILIVVGVCLDLMQRIESYLLMHHYRGFTGTGSTRGRR